MFLNPFVLALLCCSIVACGLTVAATAAGISTAVRWNHESGSRGQLLRERRWFLIETSLRMILVVQLLSLLVFVATADHLKTLLTGAMCAVGSLNANPFGVPVLMIKTAGFILCGLWLVTDRATSAAASTGLVRFKAAFLAVLCSVLVIDNVLQFRFFADLDPDFITSCCATIFDPKNEGAAAQLADLPVALSRTAFFGGLAITLAVGLRAVIGRRSTLIYSVLTPVLGVVTAAAVVSWIAPSYYELPTHHCPLCLLSGDIGYVGYPLYLFLAAAVIAGAGSGVVQLLRSIDVLGSIRGDHEQRLCVVSMTSFAATAAISIWPVMTSPFRIGGY